MTVLDAHLTLRSAGVSAADKLTNAGDSQPLIAALLGIAMVVLLITLLKLHPP